MICQECALQLYARGPLMSMPHATLTSQPSLSPSQIADLRLAASQLTGPKRRAFEAEMTLKYCGGNALMAEAQAQQDPTFRTCLAYTRLTAQAALAALRDQGYGAEQLPSPSTMAAVLNRLGFRLRKVVKAKPQKKIKETDAIFANIKKKMPTPRQREGSNA